MTKLTERDLRQLHLIAERLRSYRTGQLSLARLIADLDALWNEVRLVSSEWRDEFRGHWWTLEQVYAVARDREYEALPDDHRVLVDEAVEQLEFLVDDALSVEDGPADPEAPSSPGRGVT